MNFDRDVAFSNKIRIIDLLNKIANGEEVPEKIELLSNNEIFNYDDEIGDYNGENGDYLFGEVITNIMNLQVFLNDEVEIIKEDKKIEKISINDNGTIGFPNGQWAARNMDKAFAIKINKLIDKVNNMENNK